MVVCCARLLDVGLDQVAVRGDVLRAGLDKIEGKIGLRRPAVADDQPQTVTGATFGVGDLESLDMERRRERPLSDAIAEELGYSKTHIWVDAESWILRKADFWDVEGEHLKTITMHDIEKVSGVWTARRIFAKNHQNEHSTLIEVLDIDYMTEIDDDVFTERSLRRGIRGK